LHPNEIKPCILINHISSFRSCLAGLLLRGFSGGAEAVLGSSKTTLAPPFLSKKQLLCKHVGQDSSRGSGVRKKLSNKPLIIINQPPKLYIILARCHFVYNIRQCKIIFIPFLSTLA
jgi:hypothetical protein